MLERFNPLVYTLKYVFAIVLSGFRKIMCSSLPVVGAQLPYIARVDTFCTSIAVVDL